ncbi:hypothetical protein LOTGIDRAFT_161672 [Lottia gigantea]|uniref:RING-type domain-containing protein n=1 Tax=Lottia gigantea TaxID=225164 RepID=V4AJ56_LOTGI|nr:hypothetical protein LOTGIDRAFT_161672 [Lottia gigantea]ESO93566.1 hypothetical protein LOTGIDRAFT_161672 [Lottia gigantea]
MATAPEDRDPVCPICFDSFTKPKMVDCGHSYCLACLKKYVGEDDVEFFECAMCREQIKMPDGGIETFPTNYALEKSAPVATIGSKCQNHVKKDVECYCRKCDSAMCYKCLHLYHNDHDSFDLESEAVRVEVNEEFFEIEGNIRGFIDNSKTVSKTLCSTLTTYSHDECKKVDEFKMKAIAEIEQKAERAKTLIRHKCGESISEMEEKEDELKKKAEDVELELTIVLSSTPNESLLSRVQVLPKLKQLRIKLKESEMTLPKVEVLEWIPGIIQVPDILGILQTKPLLFPLPPNLPFINTEDPGDELQSESSVDGAQLERSEDGAKDQDIPFSYIFNFDIEKWNDEEYYFSKDVFYVTAFTRLVWRCFCSFHQDESIGVYVTLVEEDNKELDHCVIDYRLSVFLPDRDDIVLFDQEENARFYTNLSKGNFLGSFDEQFQIQFDIIRIKEVVNKV